MPGADVGRYQILALIGEGGMGRVLRAHDRQLARDVALKVVTRPTEHGQARLLREARTLARLAHPNVVPIFDAGTVGDDVYMAMELVDGENAEQWLRTPRTWQQILDVFLDAGRGLRAVHAAGIVHRDFKPQNLVIGSDGRARVTDFGLAVREGSRPSQDAADVASIVDSSKLTTTGEILGTPAYMAPEQALGGEVDHRTDQFAFCASLFEALFGMHAFEETSSTGLLDSIARRRVRKVHRADLPTRLVPILVRGLEPDPQARWPSMDALLAALARCRHRAPRWTVVAVLASAAVAAGAIAISIATSTGGSQPQPLAAATTPPPAPRIARATRLTTGPVCDESPTLSADHRVIAFDSDRSGDWEVFTIDRHTRALRQITRQPGWDYGARFSPDGSRLAYLHQDERARELRVIRLDDASLAPRSLGEVMGAFDWLDASTLVAAAPGGTLVRIGLDGARAEHRRLPEPHRIVAVAHRRGDLAVIADAGGPAHLLVLRGDGPPQDFTPRRVMSVRSLAWSPRGDGLYFNGRTALGSPALYWRAFDAREEVALEAPLPGDGIAVAADGSLLAMTTCRVQLQLVRVRPGQPAQPLFRDHDWDEWEPAPAASGRMLVTSTRNDVPELFLVDATTGEGSSIATPWARQGTLSPDGTRVAYVTASPVDEAQNGVWVMDVASRARTQLTRALTDALPAFSRDGQTIYVLRGQPEQARIHRVPVAGGDAVPITPPGILTYSVSPTTGELVYLLGPAPSARLHRGPAAGPFTAIDALPAARYSSVTFSPDGAKVLVQREPSDLVELTLATGKPEVVRSAPDVLQDLIYAPDGDGFIGALQAQKGNLFVLEGELP